MSAALGRMALLSSTLVLGALSGGCASVPPAGSGGPSKMGPPPGSPMGPPSSVAPEISSSKGVDGGFVVLWPRVVPKRDDAETKELVQLVQGRLAAITREKYPDAEVDVRPEPQRVCPKTGGCVAASVGAVVVRKDRGCVVVALTSPPGESSTTLTPWIGQMNLVNEQVSFRDPPESHIQVMEYMPCDKVIDALAAGEETVGAKIGEAAGM